jgi:hypothetical protein
VPFKKSDLGSADLLTLAEQVAMSTSPVLRGTWPRAAALLTRQALESAVDETWAQTEPAMADVSMRAQLLCLNEYLDETVAEDAAYAWAALSNACHQRSYELAPTGAELANLQAIVGQVIASAAPRRATSAEVRQTKPMRSS